MKNKKNFFHLDYKPENFGLLLKGASLDKLPKYYDRFDECIIVSDYDDELRIIGDFLSGKEITHFTNRTMASSLTREHYLKYKIKTVQMGQVFRWNHFVLMQSYLHYKSMMIGLKPYFLPEEMRKFNDKFGNEYRLKFPNTGILSIIYTLEVIRPKNLWLLGLDFYARDYFTEQLKNPDPRPSSERYAKIERLELVNHVYELFESYPETKIYLGTYYEEWPKLKNVELI